MEKTSKNSFDLVRISGQKLQGKFGKAFLGTLIMVAPLVLLACIPYAGWAISLFIWGVLDTGYIRFMRELLRGNNPSLSLIFSEVKTGWLELFLGSCLVSMFLLGTVIAIIPGIILVGYYSMGLFVAEHYKFHTIGEAFKTTAQKMEGNKTTMFSYKVLFYFTYLLIIIAFVLLGYYVWVLYAVNPVISVLLGVLAVLVFILIWAFVTVYYHSANQTFFEEVLVYEEIKNNKKSVKVEATPVVETEPVAAETPVAKSAPKKTTAKKTTQKSSNKTTKK